MVSESDAVGSYDLLSEVGERIWTKAIVGMSKDTKRRRVSLYRTMLASLWTDDVTMYEAGWQHSVVMTWCSRATFHVELLMIQDSQWDRFPCSWPPGNTAYEAARLSLMDVDTSFSKR
jgi:hypothetical protein